MNKLTKRREPFAFMLYLAIVGSGLLFFFLLLVFITKEARNQDIPLKIPGVFWVSTFVIVASSLTLQGANKAFKEERFRSYRLNIGITLLAVNVVYYFAGFRLAKNAFGRNYDEPIIQAECLFMYFRDCTFCIHLVD